MDTHTCLLDLDMCAQFGEDTNDLLHIAQLRGMDNDFLLSLMSNLLNPEMLTAMGALAHLKPRIVIYTMKGGIIQWCNIDESILIEGEAYIPSAMTFDSFMNAAHPKYPEMRFAIERVFIARQAIQIALNLPAAPEIIMTGIPKDVKRVCTTRLKPPTNPDLAYLWDDNTRIQGRFNVITIPEYSAVPEYLAAKIHSQLEIMFPGRQLKLPTGQEDSDLNLMMYLKSAPESCRIYDAQNNLLYVNVAPNALEPWPLPE